MDRLKQFIATHKLPVLVVAVIMLSATLVSVSMYLYYSSDAFRLDLSRPDYTQYRDKINTSEGTEHQFASQGSITPAVLDEFLAEYQKEQQKSSGGKAFLNNVLSDEQLGISGTQSGATTQQIDGVLE